MALKALTIAQLGDVPVRLYADEHHGYGTDFDAEVVAVMSGRKLYYGNRAHISRPRTIKLKGSVLASGYRPLEQQYNELNALGGAEIDIIAYSFIDCCGDIDLLWLHGRGVITGTDLNDKNDWGEVSVDLKGMSEWQPLNRALWHYGNERPAPRKRYSLETPVFKSFGKLPTWKVIENQEREQSALIFSKRRYSDALLMYDPTLWAGLHRYLRPSYIQTGLGYDWKPMAVDGAALNQFVELDSVYVDPGYWTAEPLSLYAFRGLLPYGEISITAERCVAGSVFEYDERVTTVDLSTLDETLFDNGYDSLLTTDILVIGEVSNLPGFIIRDSAILPGVFPDVAFPDGHPGELGIGSNYLTITVESASPVEIARLHTFRRV